MKAQEMLEELAEYLDSACQYLSDPDRVGKHRRWAELVRDLAQPQSSKEPITEQELIDWLYGVTSMESYSDCQRLARKVLGTYSVSRPNLPVTEKIDGGQS
jgi:hypothetical protein